MMTEAHMKLINCSDQCTPYSFFDEIYAQRKHPEFEAPPSPWRFDLREWKFAHADNRDIVPVGFADLETDDREWEDVTVPSVWQQNGHGSPMYLQYDPEIAEQQNRFGFLKRKVAALSSDYKNDDVGVYRTRIEIPENYLGRSVYLLIAGVCGRFEVYLNGNRLISSGPVFSPKKLLLSDGLVAGINLITVMVFRFEDVSGGVGRIADGTNGFSGIFRSVSVVADSLLELRAVSVKTGWTNTEHGTEAYLDVFTRLYNHAEMPISATVDYKLIAVCEEYDIYNLPEIRLRISGNEGVVIDPQKKTSVENRILVRGVAPWSHATPNLYDLVVIIKDADDRIITVQKRRIGFRTVRDVDRKACVNEKHVFLKATRYFSFDPQYGLTVPPERMLQDVLLMKRAHLNTVLLPHFPADPIFFDLCDRYGLYVICPLDRRDPAASAESFSEHPCVIVWSMKMDSRDEALLEEIREAINSDSGSGLFYYLCRDTGTVSDFDPFGNDAGELFGEWQDLCLDRRFREEFESAGDPELSNRTESSQSLKYIHHGDLCEGGKGAPVAIAQGIVDAFREPHPEYEIVRRKCETISIKVPEEDPSRAIIVNRDLHGSTGELELEWSVFFGDSEIRFGRGIIPSLGPGSESELLLGFESDQITIPALETVSDHKKPGTQSKFPKDLLLNLRATRSECRPWAPFGFEVASAQAVIVRDDRKAERPEIIRKTQALTGQIAQDAGSETTHDPLQQVIIPVIKHEDERKIEIDFGDVEVSFSKENGEITSLSLRGETFFRGRAGVSFYRASSNSDRYSLPTRVRAGIFSRKSTWREIQKRIRLKKLERIAEEQNLLIRAQYSCPVTRSPIIVEYRFASDGRMTAGLSFLSRVQPEHFGFYFHVVSEADFFRWYGYGPGGLFSDDRSSFHLGVYEAHSADLYHRYARPSDNGIRKGTRVLDIVASEKDYITIKRTDDEAFAFTATPYLPEDIDDHDHDELLPKPVGAELFLDFDNRGSEERHDDRRKIRKVRRYEGSFVFIRSKIPIEPVDS